MQLLPILFLILGFIAIGLGMPLAQRRIPPNLWYGFRIAKTLNSDRLWYEANAVAGRDLTIAGSVIVVSALLTMLLTQWIEAWILALVNLIVIAIAMMGATLHSFSVVKRL